MRGRIFTVASLWIGSALSCSSRTTIDMSVPGARSIVLTLPTFTPAIRTGEFGRIELADSTTALSR